MKDVPGTASPLILKNVLLAAPRGFCAGVVRAVEIVDLALECFDPPIYVRREIVHNLHVVKSFEKRGVRFVQELSEVPDGATVVFSAHGVSPAVRAAGAARGLNVIDATCPLVTKVHLKRSASPSSATKSFRSATRVMRKWKGRREAPADHAVASVAEPRPRTWRIPKGSRS
jgi:hypothetical protein